MEEYEASTNSFKKYEWKNRQLLNIQGNGNKVEVGWLKESHERASTNIKYIVWI